MAALICEVEKDRLDAGFSQAAVAARLAIRAVLPHIRAARSGCILAILWIGGNRGAPGFGVYRTASAEKRAFLFAVVVIAATRANVSSQDQRGAL